MIYAAFTMYLLLMVFLGLGVYRLWSQMSRAAWLNWALLPGTVVSEMAYIFGCLITGGEVRHAKILPTRTGRGANADAEPKTDVTPKLRVLGPILASLLAIVACGGGILAVNALLGEDVMEKLGRGGWFKSGALPQELPTSWAGFWDQIEGQVGLTRWSCETFLRLDWLNWRVPLFVYLALCLSVRLGPLRRDLRATLAAAVVIAVVIAGLGQVFGGLEGLMKDLWPLVTYVYATLLLVLLVTLLIRGSVALVHIFMGKGPT